MKLKSKLAAFAVVGGLVLGALGGAQVAQAAQISPNGGITITPTTGNSTTVGWLTSLSTTRNCPSGTQLVGTFAYQGGANQGSVAFPRDASIGTLYGQTGLGAAPIQLDLSIANPNPYLTNTNLNGTTLVRGTNWEIRVYCFASATSPDFVNDPYFALEMTLNAAGTWAVYTAPVPAIATSVSLTAGTTANAGEVSLTASVKDAAGTAVIPAVAGSIAFKDGATTVATIPTVNGVAAVLLAGVASGNKVYTAEFQPSNTVYSGSTSAPANLTVGAAGTAASTITVTIPNNVGALTLTGVSSSVALGTAVFGSGTLNASGILNATVTDTRQLDYPAWSLTGQVGDFTASGGKLLDGKYLGWTPGVNGSAVSGPQSSVAGAAVLPAPGSANGIKTVSTLATGQPNNAGITTNAVATLSLKAPSNTPQGAYSATLTLTLI